MIPPAESEAGLQAYEQVQAFAALRRKKLPWVYALFPVLLAIMGGTAFAAGAALLGWGCLAAAALFALYAAWNWRRLLALDVTNRALLARLQAQYGDNLPWLEVERQLAQLREIEAEHLPPPPDPPR
jgi:hypothetical protein